MQRPTIKTIAQETGLSIATVSKALNDSPQGLDVLEGVVRRELKGWI